MKQHIYGLECASEFAVNTITGCLERGIQTIEIKESEQTKFVAWFEDNIKGFLWWVRGSGRVVGFGRS